ncbi:uncharacterized protein UV8b_02579 [Ustilaginoidea virens]|uniref:Uncharacterized protein n=1 Tax=Ustilaginoidea virens TaxID=1159556 RepID=A0A8E5HN63_USTVR|nr:uncharacterized protein UV8b_02579 [Ustilaginoidea virens]QUC18338.1 hypothetical protein UV8b_02579 [Ustilaginoidea virens]
MKLTVSTPEGPFESMVFLRDRMDWPSWIDDVSAIARALDIWQYVDPDSRTEPMEPLMPFMPSKPKPEHLPVREQDESDKVYDLRVERERNYYALLMREYDISYERYRMDATQYIIRLNCHASQKNDIQKLYRIIYRSVSEKYQAYLKLDNAATPRSMVQSLRARINPPSDEDRASAALGKLNAKLNTQQPTKDKQDLIEAVTLAVVELHRLKSPSFDEATAVKDLVRSLQAFDRPFADAWSRKAEGNGAAATVLDIVEDFKYQLRKQEDKSFVPDTMQNSETVATHKPAQNDSVTERNNKVATPTPANGHIKGGSSPASPAGVKGNNASERAAQDQLVDKSSGAPDQAVKSVKQQAASPLPENVSKPRDSPKPETLVKEKPPTSNKKAESTSLRKAVCPGCQLRHLFRDDAWWENCYVFYELSQIGGIPSYFIVKDRFLDLVRSRLQDFPAELKRSQEWASRRTKKTKLNEKTNGNPREIKPEGPATRKTKAKNSEERANDTIKARAAVEEPETSEFQLW